jgi:hypothetical protein
VTVERMAQSKEHRYRMGDWIVTGSLVTLWTFVGPCEEAVLAFQEKQLLRTILQRASI